jgi:hypothetical protein
MKYLAKMIATGFLSLSCFATLAHAGERKQVTLQELKDFFSSQGKKVVTFIGYSGAEYEFKFQMLATAKKELLKYDPAYTIINIGATSEGIGAVYLQAKQRGFQTTGIVSSLAYSSKTDGLLRPEDPVDHIFYIKDDTWGGYLPGTLQLAPTSEAMVSVSDVVIGIGGGEVGRDELDESLKRNKTVHFFSADMNHDKAKKKGLSDFKGAATEFYEKNQLSFD